MDDAAVKAYGRVYGVCKHAIERAGGRVSDADFLNCSMYPAKRVSTLVLTKAMRMRALSNTDDALIAQYLADVPDGFDAFGDRTNQDQKALFFDSTMNWHDLTSKAAAERLGVSVQFVNDLIKRGKLDGVRVGGKWRVTSRSVTTRINELKRGE